MGKRLDPEHPMYSWKQVSMLENGSPLPWPPTLSELWLRTMPTIPTILTKSTGTTFPLPILMVMPTPFLMGVCGERPDLTLGLLLAVRVSTPTGTGDSTGEKPESVLSSALKCIVVQRHSQRSRCSTSVTLSRLWTQSLSWAGASTPTHSCGYGPMAMTTGHILRITRRSSSWLLMQAMLSIRFMELFLTQSTRLTFTQLLEHLTTGTSLSG